MVRAAEKIVPVFVDCDWGRKNKDLSDKYKVRGYPTVVFTDPDGTVVEPLKGRDAGAVESQILAVAEKHGRAATWLDSWEKAVEQAKEESKPVLYLFVTAKDDSKKLEEALIDEALKELREKFVLAKSEIRKDNADAKLFKTASSTQPVILVLDPAAEKPEEKPVKKLTGKRTVKELKKELEAALKALEPKDEMK